MNRLLSKRFWVRDVRHMMQQEGFRSDPLGIAFRGALWMIYGAVGVSPVFRLKRGGPLLKVDSKGEHVGAGSAFVLRDWAEPELHYLDKLVEQGDVFVDCGANIGVYALMAEQLVGEQGKVVAIEPGRDSFARLERNLELNDSYIVAVNKALSDHEGVSKLYHSGDGPSAFSMVQPSADGEFEEIHTATLDGLVKDLGLECVDCLKVDVEGFEPLVLRGGMQTLERYHPNVIFEINSNGAKRSGRPLSEAWELLSGLGYEFYRLVKGDFVRMESFPEAGGNLIALHPAKKKQ